MDPAFRSAVDLAGAIRRREIRCRDLLERALDRIERLNPKINAVVTLDSDRARRLADAADAAVASGAPLGPLHGLPITVKDTLETEGIRTTAGAPMLSGHVPSSDATAVARLKTSGAIVFGKTNTPLFAGDAQSYNEVFGTTNNPWDTGRSPGGSSGGSAAAVAAGLTAFELGSDIGGSIRNPAHYCGVFGHKPTYGIIPLRGHIPGPPGTLGDIDLAVLGPLARSADDLAATLSVLAGPADDRAAGWRLELPPPRRASLRGYRVAAWLDDPACPTDAPVRASLEAAVESLRKSGVAVDERARPVADLAEVNWAYQRLLWPIMTGGMPPDEFEALAARAGADPPGDDSRMAVFARSATIRHREWLAIHEWREQCRARWADFFRDFDVLLCPITPTAALRHDHSEPPLARTIEVNGKTRPYWDQIVWAGLVTMAHLPATVAPVGRTPGGLPVGVQIVGPYLGDQTTIDFAGRLTERIGGFEPPPGF